MNILLAQGVPGIEHQWFEGVTSQAGMPAGWIWEGKTVPAFTTTGGENVALYGAGQVLNVGDLQPRGTPEVNVSNPVGFASLPLHLSVPGGPNGHTITPVEGNGRNWAYQWNQINNSFGHTGLGAEFSKLLYGTLDGFYTFGSTLSNGRTGAYNLQGDHLVGTYGSDGADRAILGGYTTMVSLPLAAVGSMGGSAGESSLYRFDTRSPSQINQAGGFKSWGSNMNLLEHANGTTIANKTSGYVSTTTNQAAALELSGGRPGYIYQIRPIQGVNVNAKLGAHSPFPWESEIAIPNIISNNSIIRHWPVNF